MKKKYGISSQIIALFVLVAIVMSVLLLVNLQIFVGMHGEISDQALAMVRKEKLHEEKMIASNRDEKIEIISTIMLMTTPELLWTFNYPALEPYAEAITRDVDIASVTFSGGDGEFLVGEKLPKGSHIISHDIVNEGEKLGSMVIGVTSEVFEKRIQDMTKRIEGFEAKSQADVRKLQKYQIIFVFVLCGIFGIILFLALLVVGNIIGPIKNLVGILDSYGKGDTTIRADVNTGNEIGFFAEKFNGMLDQINESSTTLQTSELKYRTLFEKLQDAVNKKEYSFRFVPESRKDDLSISLNRMLLTLGENEAATNSRDWLKTGQANLNSTISAERDLTILCQKAITVIAKYADARVGTIYIKDSEEKEFVLVANYAFRQNKGSVHRLKPGEGLAGQAVLGKKSVLFSDIPRDYMKIESALGETFPTTIFAIPLIYETDVKGVIELGSVKEFTALQINFVELAADSLAVALNSAMFNEKLEKLLAGNE